MFGAPIYDSIDARVRIRNTIDHLFPNASPSCTPLPAVGAGMVTHREAPIMGGQKVFFADV